MSTQDIVETFRQECRGEGRIEGLTEALLDIYTERFGAPPADMLAVVENTRDRDTLRAWHKLAALAPAEEVLAAIRSRTTS